MKVQPDSEFPKFIKYLTTDFVDVVNAGSLEAAFKRHTYEEANLFLLVVNGGGPKVSITRIEGDEDYASFDTGWIEDEEIFFPAWLAREFENGKDIVRVKAGRVHRAGAIMMKMLVTWTYATHWDQTTRYIDGHNNSKAFVREVYGHGKIHTRR